MLKELLITFLICLVIGSIINGMNQPAPPPAATSESQPATTEPGTNESSEGSEEQPSSKAQETSDSNFDQDVLKSELPVLVDFSASWCGPCQHMAPIVDKLAHDYAGKAKVYKIDIDQNPEVASKYKVTALPTFMMFREGRSVASHTGAMPQEMLAGVIDRQLGAQ